MKLPSKGKICGVLVKLHRTDQKQYAVTSVGKMGKTEFQRAKRYVCWDWKDEEVFSSYTSYTK